MAEFRPVTITEGSFAFCRFTVAILLWLSLLLQWREGVALVFVIMVLSVILKIRRAPLVLLYSLTVERLFPSKPVTVDERGMQFAHLVGAVGSMLCCTVLYLGNPLAGWILTGLLAIMKTSAAFGRCSALKLYNCMNGGNCCRFGRMARKLRR